MFLILDLGLEDIKFNVLVLDFYLFVIFFFREIYLENWIDGVWLFLWVFILVLEFVLRYVVCLGIGFLNDNS